jgi:hypothetical protein
LFVAALEKSAKILSKALAAMKDGEPNHQIRLLVAMMLTCPH